MRGSIFIRRREFTVGRCSGFASDGLYIGDPSPYRREGQPHEGCKRGRGIIDLSILVSSDEC